MPFCSHWHAAMALSPCTLPMYNRGGLGVVVAVSYCRSVAAGGARPGLHAQVDGECPMAHVTWRAYLRGI